MNPLASNQPVRRVLTLVSALSLIVLSVACGSSNSNPPANPAGFSNSSLTGTYVFSASGIDSSNGAPIVLTGAFAANGTGGITGGAMDAVDPEIAVDTNETLSASSSYEVNTDGRGKASLVSSAGTFILDFVLTSGSHGLVTEFDGNGTGSGTLDLQTSITSQSQLAGSYAFTLGGFDGNGNPFASVGAFTLDQNGNITTGAQDFNDNDGLTLNITPSGTVTVGSGTAPGSVVLTSSSQTFDFYPIDATHLKLVETDSSGTVLSGDAFTQSSTSLPTGSMAFSMAGGAFSVTADAGLITYDGGSSTFSGSEDVNSNGTIFPGVSFTSAPVTQGPVGGRTVVSLSGFQPANTLVVYPSNGGLLMLEADANNVTLGSALVQPSTQPIQASQNYAFNLSAWNAGSGFEENDIAQFLTTSSAFGGVVDLNDDAGNGQISATSQTLAGSYTSNANGTGAATTTANGGAYVSFNFYPASSDTFLVLETDTNQIGTGIIELQSPPSGSVAQSRISLAHPAILRPAVRSRLAARHKK
jgi:hypothetical protein